MINSPFLSTNELIGMARNKLAVKCSGVPGQLCVLKDGSILFDADEVRTHSLHQGVTVSRGQNASRSMRGH